MKDRIAFVISESKLTKTKFAEALNVSVAFVSQMCSGVAKPSNRTISDICRIFEIQEDWLRYGLEPMRKELSREEELSLLVAKMLGGSNEFQKSVVRMICSRTDEELKVLEESLRAIYEDITKEKSQG